MKVKIHEIIDANYLSESMRYAYLDKQDFVATNAHTIVIHSSVEIFGEDFLKPLGDDTVLIPFDCLKQMYLKNSMYIIKSVNTDNKKEYYIEINIKASISLHRLLINGEEHRFPNYNSVLPSKYDIQLEKIGIKPKLLYQLQQAIDPNSLGVYLKFSGENRAIGVKVINSNLEKYKALIMPMILNY